mmetsp:Transcript_45857/g.120245  ORF Transcript_45857/g.120245 Transcript_45857/m.120245 type:complete len:225 (-) Transcript_45857:301-975(-)
MLCIPVAPWLLILDGRTVGGIVRRAVVGRLLLGKVGRLIFTADRGRICIRRLRELATGIHLVLTLAVKRVHPDDVQNVLANLVAALCGWLNGIRIVPLRVKHRAQVDEWKPALPRDAGHHVVESGHARRRGESTKHPARSTVVPTGKPAEVTWRVETAQNDTPAACLHSIEHRLVTSAERSQDAMHGRSEPQGARCQSAILNLAEESQPIVAAHRHDGIRWLSR